MKRMAPIILILGLFLFVRVAEAQWTTSQRITWDSGDSASPALAVDASGNLHVVWYDNTPGNYEIYYKKSTDGGSTWTTSQRITWDSGYSAWPNIAVDASGNLHVVWYDDTPGNYEVYYKKSTDGGSTWMASQRITWNSGVSEYPDIAVDASGNLHVVWEDNTPGNYELYYGKSTDEGSTWMTSQRIIWSSGVSDYPDLAVDASGNVHIVWKDYTPGNWEIYYKKSSDGGSTWMTSQRITWSSGSSACPDLAVDASGNVHVVWKDYTPGNWEIYYRKSTDGGSTWMTSQRIIWNPGASASPAIGVDNASGNLHAVWDDDTPGNCEIYYKRSTDGGSTWMTSQRMTWNSGSSLWPAVAVDSSGNLHLVWSDYPPWNREVYYRKYVK